MAILTRETTATGVTNNGAPLTNAELDNNFVELQQNKLDITVTSPSSGQVIKYNGSAWVNSSDSVGATEEYATGEALALAIALG